MAKIPPVGLGTFLSPGDAVTTEAVRYAIEEAGYRHIDTAWAYRNEKAIGTALADLFKRNVIKREDIWVTTKLWCQNYDPVDVEPSCRDQLAKLGLDYVDLYLLHFPMRIAKAPEHLPIIDGKLQIIPGELMETYKAVEKLIDLGLIKRIGVSNFTIELLEKIRFCPGIRHQPYCNQVEMHLYMQQEALIQYCKSRGIYVVAWGPLGRGGQEVGKQVNLLGDPVLNEVAKEVGKPVGSVALRFLLELGDNVTVIPKSLTPARIKSNNELDFRLTPEQIARLKKCERCQRLRSRKPAWGIDLFGDEW
jgi:aldehyde reductase